MATLKIGLVQNNMRTDATNFNVVDHTEIGSDIPVAHLGFMVDATTPNNTDIGYQLSAAFTVRSSNEAQRNYYWACRNEDNQFTVDRDSAFTEFSGPRVIADGGLAIYGVQVTSHTPGGFSVEPVAASFPNSSLFNSTIFAGSVTIAASGTPIISATSGTLTTCNLSMQPDLILFFGNTLNEITTSFLAAVRYGYGWVDCRSDARGGYKTRSFSYNFWNVSNKNTIGLYSDKYFGAFVAGSGDFEQGISLAYSVASVSTTGIVIETGKNEHNFSTDQQWAMMAFKFNDPDVNWKVGHYTMIGTSAIQTLQTNSIHGIWMNTMVSNISTLNYRTDSQAYDAENFGFGTAHRNGTLFSANASDQASSTITNNINFADADNAGNTFNVRDGARYSIQTLDLQQNYALIGLGGSPANHDAEIFLYTVIGEAVAAPDHLQQNGGQSIYLVSDQENDSLLLSEEAPAPASGLDPKRREFPLDDQRFYPIRVNSVRDFPNV